MAGAQSEKCFVCKQEMHTSAEKKEPRELVNRYKEKYDKELKDLEGKTNYDYKRKKLVPMKPAKQSFIAAAVKNFYTDLSRVRHDDST